MIGALMQIEGTVSGQLSVVGCWGNATDDGPVTVDYSVMPFEEIRRCPYSVTPANLGGESGPSA